MLKKMLVKPVFNTTVLDAIKKASGRISEKVNRTQLMISLKEDGSNQYMICRDYKAIEEVQYSDFMGSEQDLELSMNRVLKEFNLEFKMLPNSAIVQFISDEKGKLRMCLYEKNKYVKDILFDDIFHKLEL